MHNSINQSDINLANNHAVLAGTMESAPSYSHEYDGVRFYSIRLKVNRSNGNKYDVLHVFIPESALVLDQVLLDTGVRIRVEGYLVQSELKSMSDVSVVSQGIRLLNPDEKDENYIHLGGLIHRIFDLRTITGSKKVIKPMIIKHTTQSDDKIRNLTVKVSCWNNTAKLVEGKYQLGDKVFIRGQLESKAVKFDKTKKDKKSTVTLHEASVAVILGISDQNE